MMSRLMRALLRVVHLAIGLLIGASLPSQRASLVKDINPRGSSNPASIVSVFGRLFFFADDGVHGQELWTSDGTAAGTRLVKDIVPGPLSPFGVELARLGDRVFFLASRYSSQRFVWDVELWGSDGTAKGTFVVRQIGSTRSGGIPTPNFFRWRNKLYFQAAEAVRGSELWVSDGTAAGTRLVADIDRQRFGSFPHDFAALGDRFLFVANNVAAGRELWVSDGTTAGTRLLKDIDPGVGSSGPAHLLSWRGRVYFSAQTASGRELWVSDGTAQGTRLFKDLRPGAASSFPLYFRDFGDRFVFVANDGTSGHEPWVSDGTVAGTKRLVDYRPGAGSSTSSAFSMFGSRRFFFAATSGSGRGTELTVSDGTAKGTRLFQDLNPGAAASNPGNRAFVRELPYAYLRGKLYFAATSATNGRELWVLDPNAAATQRFGTPCGLRIEASDAVMGLKDGVKLHVSGLRRTSSAC